MHLKNLFGMSVDDAPFYNMTFENVGRKADFKFFSFKYFEFCENFEFFLRCFFGKKV